MQIFSSTPRLVLREILPSDVEGMYELDSDPEVHRYLRNKPVQNKEQVAEVIEFIRKQYVENGIGRWAVVEKETNNFVGWTGLKLVKEKTNNHINYYDLGYRLIKKYWGKGYATESALASLAYGFDVMKLEEVFAAAEVNNLASNNILKKIGFQWDGTFDFDGSESNWYRLEKGTWLNRI